MQLVASGLAGLAGIIFIAASAAMNWMSRRAQGKTALEGQILGRVSIAVDVVKALSPFFIAAAWVHRQWLRAAGLSFAVFAPFFTFSVLSALGFVASNRGAVASGRAAASMRQTQRFDRLFQAASTVNSLG
jgi:hypothetical protein